MEFSYDHRRANPTRPPSLEAEFIAGFHAIGEERYPTSIHFHLLMHEGKLTAASWQAWGAHRYSTRRFHKDARYLARSEIPHPSTSQRILDHDGDAQAAASKMLVW